MLPLGCRLAIELPDGMTDFDEYIKTHGILEEIPMKVIEKMNRDYEKKLLEFNAEDNESWIESANMIAYI